MKVNIVGCGLSGITSAILLKEKGYDVEIFESRNHIGGNCFDSNLSGTLVHNYGPHIFHTNDEDVFSFLSRYTEWGRLATYTYLDMWMAVKQAMIKLKNIN